METSVFTDKANAPCSEELKKALGQLYTPWLCLVDLVKEKHPVAFEEWNYSKAGWNCRIKDKKRVIIYLMPGYKQFKVSIVLGQKASDKALSSGISAGVKEIIEAAPVHAEGRGVRIVVDNKSIIADIKKLIDIKLVF